MPFEHALVSLDDGRRLSAAENQPLHNSRTHRIFSELGADPQSGPGVCCLSGHAAPLARDSRGQPEVAHLAERIR